MRIFLLSVCCLFYSLLFAQSNSFYKEKYRPQFHFTPAIHWANDPNGLVYHKGEYHLFYQFNPFGNRWGHMSWGHAVSKDLVHWQHLPVAIAEEKDTMIFSGSCVVDKNNTSGFAQLPGQIPMVAVYTAHIDGLNQSQHIAYSLDDGITWIKYNHNPVLDLGKKDFRDPKVFWYEPQQKWVMVVMLPVEKRAQFYTSKDLKQWELMSEFGPAGDTTGIWECPDLFETPIQDEPGKTKWVFMHLPAPYMQYFVGEFDGIIFKNESRSTKIYRPDYGPDYYAAIAYNNLPEGNKPVSIGWINNWNYANDIPTLPWKSAMSLPREMSVKKIDGEWILLQQPANQVNQQRSKVSSWKNNNVKKSYLLPAQSQSMEIELVFSPSAGSIAGVRLAKGSDHYIEIGYDKEKQALYVDRSKAGDTSFHESFAKLSRYEKFIKPKNGKIKLRIFFDKSIVEVFANDGEAAMTVQLFPNEKNNAVELFSNGKNVFFEIVNLWQMKSIW